MVNKHVYIIYSQNAPHPQKRGYGDGLCIMVAHAVYVVLVLTCVH